MDTEIAQIKINNLIEGISKVHNDVCSAWIQYAEDNELELFNQKPRKITLHSNGNYSFGDCVTNAPIRNP